MPTAKQPRFQKKQLLTNPLPVFQPAKHLYRGSCLSHKQELICCTLNIPKNKKPKLQIKPPINQTKPKNAGL